MLESEEVFEFRIEGQVLRSSLEELLIQSHLSREKTIVIEYLKQQSMPELESQLDLDDWVCRIFPFEGVVVTGLANGTLNTYRGGRKDVVKLEGVPARTFEMKKYDGSNYVLSSYLNRSLRVDRLNLDTKVSF
jgi:hypothetical protein